MRSTRPSRSRLPEPRGTRSLASRLGFGLLFAAVLLYLGEVGLRIAGVAPAYQAGSMGSWRMSPNLGDAEGGAPLRGPRDGHDFRVTTNADGLRTRLPKAHAEGRVRVALMGDSTVFGWGVDDGGAVSDGLQAALDAAEPGAFEVLNAGQPGYSTTQVAWFFEEVLAAYTPDRVVVFQTMHDFNKVLVSDRELLDGGLTLTARLRVALVTHSRLYQVLRRSVWPLTDQAMLLPDQDSGEPRVDRVSEAERFANFEAMRTGLMEWEGGLLLGYLPFHADLIGHGRDRPSMRWMEAYGLERGVPVVDVRACCGRDGEALVLPDDRGHLAVAGNHLAGAALAPAILASVKRGGTQLP